MSPPQTPPQRVWFEAVEWAYGRFVGVWEADVVERIAESVSGKLVFTRGVGGVTRDYDLSEIYTLKGLAVPSLRSRS